LPASLFTGPYAAKRAGRDRVICENDPEAQAETTTRVRVA
jgi:hypothetical protein